MATGTLKVLVADDHEVVRKGLRTILEEQPGWEVSGEASDGREAVDKVRALKPDVTVVDVGMATAVHRAETRTEVRRSEPARLREARSVSTPSNLEKMWDAARRVISAKAGIANTPAETKSRIAE